MKTSEDNSNHHGQYGKAAVVWTIVILVAFVSCAVLFSRGFRSFLKHHLPRCQTTTSTQPVTTSSTILDPAQLDGSKALQEVKDFVSLGPRVSGFEGTKTAAQYLAGRLKAIGIQPDIDEFSDNTVVGPTHFHNVSGTVKGTGDGLIILASHFDTKPGISDDFIGANDSGSSTGLLLELARVIRKTPDLPSTVMFVFLDGEECKKDYAKNDGLHGSLHLAAKLLDGGQAQHVQAFILLDMIGDKDLSVTIPLNCTPQIASLALTCAREEGVRDKFSIFQGSMLDDHVPFLKAGMPVVDLIDFEYGSAPEKNDYWHTPEDTMDKLSPESLQIVGRVVLRMINKLM
jgi:glutaminyl-peptide cyclotransferase